MKDLKKDKWKRYSKNPRYLTLCRSKYEDRLLRMDLYHGKDNIYFYSFNDVKTGYNIAVSEDPEKAFELLSGRGYEIIVFDRPTEYYQYIIDFLIG